MGLKINSSVLGKLLGGEKLLVKPASAFRAKLFQSRRRGEGVGGRETRSGLECLKDQRV